ncbi:unnamed protein product [Prorocentrum cordatum]|uniref:Uncharacterized protein n=1 Tax=Prorocentrum cordatum TaxID=2364126 RepID=A0ABN9W416_9DINO|nr:unnamed protein product [Polarella glacialis]
MYPRWLWRWRPAAAKGGMESARGDLFSVQGHGATGDKLSSLHGEAKDLSPQLAAARDAMMQHGPIGEGRQDVDSVALAIGIPRWPKLDAPLPPKEAAACC